MYTDIKQTLNSRTLIDVHRKKKIPNWLRQRHRNFAKLIEAVNINKLNQLMG